MLSMNQRTCLDRRELLATAGGGFGGLALSSLLAEDQTNRPDHSPRAKSVIQIFCSGGLSHVDTFDYKPELERRAGTPFDPEGKLQFFASKPGNCQPSYWKFRQHGESGLWMSDLLPKLSTCIDDMAFVYSMQSKTALHGPGAFMMNTGQTLPGFPSMGSWVTYGLGSESENLPSFVVLPDVRGLPPGGIINWGAGFLPAEYQATPLDTSNPTHPIADLFPPAQFDRQKDLDGLGFLAKINRIHQKTRNGNTELEARIKAYEMAARLQLSAPEVTELRGESAATKRLYDIDHPDIGPFGRQCLLARRLVERGVRFVQIYCGAENTTAEKIRPNWDSHEDLPRDHGYWGPILDTGASALIKDLKSRGMLDSTLVMGTSEFGRQPANQGKANKGRDHNGGAFTAWLAGGGIKGGTGYGASDDLGFKAADNVVHSYELHATALHLLGLDHEKLSWYHNGLEQRLTGFEGKGVIDELLA